MSTGGILLDDRRHAPLRTVIGRLMARATTADFAVARVRLTAVELTDEEVATLESCRVLLGRLDVDALSTPDPAGPPSPAAVAGLGTLRSFLQSGRIQVRTAGATLWVPDFSILGGIGRGPGCAGDAVCMVGAHYFARPYPTRGPALTCLLADAGSVASARERFDELWEFGYDVLPVIADRLDALLAGGLARAP
jgi:hypothetical protein